MNNFSHFPKHLRIACLPYSRKLDSFALKLSDGKTYYTHDAFIIRLLAHVLKFSYEILAPKTMSLGSPKTDGNWTGLIGMVQRGETDMAVGGLAISEERRQATLFSYPYIVSGISFYSDKPQYLRNTYALLHTFQWTLWLAVIALVITASCLFYIFSGRKVTFTKVLFSTVESLVENSIDFKNTATSLRLLTISWMVGVLIITTCFKGVLLCFLSFPTLSGVRTFEDLSQAAKDPAFRCLIFPGSHIYRTLKQSSQPLVYPITECIRLHQNHTDHYKVQMKNATFKKAFIADRFYSSIDERNFFASNDELFAGLFAIAVKEDFCCIRELNIALNRITATGLIQKHVREFKSLPDLGSTSVISEDSNPEKPLTLADLLLAFKLLIIGLSLSLFAFVIELIVVKVKIN